MPNDAMPITDDAISEAELAEAPRKLLGLTLEEKRARARAKEKRWAAANPEKAREKRRRKDRRRYYREPERHRAESRLRYARATGSGHKLPRTSIEVSPTTAPLSRPQAIDMLGAIRRAIPAHWSPDLRDDVSGDVAVLLMGGHIAMAGISSAVQIVGRRYRSEEYRTVSLDEPAYEGGPNRVDLLVGHNPLEEDDPADDE